MSRTPGRVAGGALGVRRCQVRTGYGLRARILDQSIEARIAREVERAHAALTETIDDLVLADRRR